MGEVFGFANVWAIGVVEQATTRRQGMGCAGREHPRLLGVSKKLMGGGLEVFTEREMLAGLMGAHGSPKAGTRASTFTVPPIRPGERGRPEPSSLYSTTFEQPPLAGSRAACLGAGGRTGLPRAAALGQREPFTRFLVCFRRCFGACVRGNYLPSTTGGCGDIVFAWSETNLLACRQRPSFWRT